MEKPPPIRPLPDCLQEQVKSVLQPLLIRGFVKIDADGDYQAVNVKHTAVIDTTNNTGEKVGEVLEK